MNKIMPVALVLTTLLMGCSSTESVPKTYLLPLPDTAMTATMVNNSQPVVVVRPVAVAEHLAGTGLVYQISDTEVVQAQQNLWAEGLSQQLTRLVTNELRHKQSRYWFNELSPLLRAGQLPQLELKVSQFNGHYNGLAYVSGQWTLTDAAGNVVRREPFSIRVPLAESGYDAQVRALAEGVSRLTTQISQSVAAVDLSA
ncbi:hypothetical protein ABT56_12165 [Photobacterium aquae]|uniref:ABC-type transport auxiliary lipoprotein component domain-containing protein n=1 Tax=Photobacterium aquae TaxID=1195763 RepID=A0A0J1JT46_9GAMM|nr:ABC-type transport auxiliary lipoprotein family protein [Photobacterium aquae]KLV05452.1 hypothetical protein ABT56_12165 [Photobacterium aquae]